MAWLFKNTEELVLYLNEPIKSRRIIELYVHPTIALRYEKGLNKALKKSIAAKWPARGARRWAAAILAFDDAIIQEFKAFTITAKVRSPKATYIWNQGLDVFTSPDQIEYALNTYSRRHLIIRYKKDDASEFDTVYAGTMKVFVNGAVLLKTRGSYRSFKLEKIKEVAVAQSPVSLGTDFRKVSFIMDADSGVVTFSTLIEDLRKK